MSPIEQSIRLQLLQGVRSSEELAKAARVSQPTISRALSRMGDSVVRIAQGRSSRYALRSTISELGSSWPLFLIDPHGDPIQIGRLHTLAKSSCWIERTAPDTWRSLFEEEFKEGRFPGIPWFLDDARPQGFLGRAFARRYGRDLGQVSDPTRWSHEAVIESMIRFGVNLPGAFVLGREALAGALRQDNEAVVSLAQRDEVYPRLATSVLEGNIVGSSAGGEQPKFTARLECDGIQKHVLVKFSPEMDHADGRRWADLLYCEKVAADVLSERGFLVPRGEVFDFANRRFLEVERFDRTPDRGRIPIVSLLALDAAFFGVGGIHWDRAATQLFDSGWIDAKDAASLSSLWKFGGLIGNSDMHSGNVSFVLSPEKPVKLAPVYDMLPMVYRPGLEGQILGFQPDALAMDARSSREVEMAASFWRRVADATSVSDDFRAISSKHLAGLSS